MQSPAATSPANPASLEGADAANAPQPGAMRGSRPASHDALDFLARQYIAGYSPSGTIVDDVVLDSETARITWTQKDVQFFNGVSGDNHGVLIVPLSVLVSQPIRFPEAGGRRS